MKQYCGGIRYSARGICLSQEGKQGNTMSLINLIRAHPILSGVVAGGSVIGGLTLAANAGVNLGPLTTNDNGKNASSKIGIAAAVGTTAFAAFIISSLFVKGGFSQVNTATRLMDAFAGAGIAAGASVPIAGLFD